jgi:hypothetical protein
MPFRSIRSRKASILSFFRHRLSTQINKKLDHNPLAAETNFLDRLLKRGMSSKRVSFHFYDVLDDQHRNPKTSQPDGAAFMQGCIAATLRKIEDIQLAFIPVCYMSIA